jgi:hypothetical protein
MQLIDAKQIRIGHDCIDPVDKMTRIREKAEIEDSCRLAEEVIFGKPANTPNKVTDPLCQSCGHKLRYTEEEARYECTHCSIVWEYVGVMDERPIWLCVFNPSDKES